MLILSRKPRESVVLRVGAVEIVVTVSEVKAGQAVRLGFEAPPEVVILRSELLEESRAKESRRP